MELKDFKTNLRGRWAWHSTFRINLIWSGNAGTFMLKLGESSPHSNWDLCGQTDRHESRPEQEYIPYLYTLWDLPRLLLPVTYICTNLVFTFWSFTSLQIELVSTLLLFFKAKVKWPGICIRIYTVCLVCLSRCLLYTDLCSTRS